MLENIGYTFFDQALAEKFAAICQKEGVETRIEYEETHIGDHSYHVQIDQQVDELVMEKLEEVYSDMLFGEQAAQIEGNDDNGALADACGVQVQLASGEFTTVAIHPGIMNKILSVLSVEELQAFLAQVAEDIENPKAGPICCRKDLPGV